MNLLSLFDHLVYNRAVDDASSPLLVKEPRSQMTILITQLVDNGEVRGLWNILYLTEKSRCEKSYGALLAGELLTRSNLLRPALVTVKRRPHISVRAHYEQT
jgi:hypothetical protein